MKKILYSNYTKIIAVVLFIISIISGALIVTDGIAKYCDERERVYGFESDFSETNFFHHMLLTPENAVCDAYYDFYYSDNENGYGQTLEEHIEKRLKGLYYGDKINYYVRWNDKVFTNCGASDGKELTDAQFYTTAERNSYGNVVRSSTYNDIYDFSFLLEETSRFDTESTITISTNVKEDYVEKCLAVWECQAAIVNDTFTETFVFVLLAALCLIYLICVCGKNKDGEKVSMWIDNIWTEIHLAAMSGFSLGAVIICVILLDEHYTGHFPLNLLNMVVGTTAALAGAVVITSLLSVVRNIKCKRFLKTSVIFRVLKWCFKTFIKVVKWFYGKLKSYKKVVSHTLSKKTGIILISMLFIYTAVIGLCGIFTPELPVFLLFAVLIFLFAGFVVSYRARDIDEIKKGAGEVRNGNLTYKIPELKSEDMKLLGENINDIAKGLDESVSAKLKAERLKTELITNVSHDLKTPLTSIISYTELLSNISGLPEEAKDYIKIISKKSDRLKNLTQDLFDISKVQSGNENVVLEKLDVSLLINQSLGEHDSEIKKSELTFCVNTPKELFIKADGRKMSRVISNLISNILKYTMKNTRVFISASEQGCEAVIEFKNIASYPMDFEAKEIIGRFVRGDESRTKEGNGLGLAIAKSYTEICGGKFDVITDGDMFKAIIKFEKC